MSPASRLQSAARLDAARSALIVVDVQNDFCHEDGALARRGIDVAPAQAMAARLVPLIDRIRAQGVPVIYLINAHDSWTDSAVWLERHGPGGAEICRPGSWGAGFYAVGPRADDRIVPKHRYNAFVGTELDLILRARGITTLLFTGIATNVCVETTARDAFCRDYRVVLVSDCLAGSSAVEHEASLRSLERYFNALVLDADAAEAALGGTAAGRVSSAAR
jgi:ureidoacrylate peracid hydrolase